MIRRLLTIAFLGAFFGSMPTVSRAAENESLDPYANETKEQRDARMEWWREARFGMFIHWGVYSVPAGTYKGKQIGGIGEWIMNNGKIPVAEYRAVRQAVQPGEVRRRRVGARWPRTPGMKYIVITSKHHDGFAMFDSKASDWNIVDATPFGKDLLKPLAEACQKHGLKLGLLLLAGPGLEPSRRRGGAAGTGTRPRTATWTSTSARSPCRRSRKS